MSIPVPIYRTKKNKKKRKKSEKKVDNRTFFPIVLIMDNKTYHVSGLFETGTETATFPRTREGLNGAYDFVGNAAAYVIKCGDEVVEELDPWAEYEPTAADLAQAERDERLFKQELMHSADFR